MGRRLAGEGYAVLVPNPFYRVAKAPLYETAANVDFSDPATRAKLGPLMGSINAPGAAEKDAAAYVAFLDAQPQVDTRAQDRHAGLLHGRRAGGADAPRRVPDRIGAGASFHGGGLVTDKPDSPHLLAPQIHAPHVLRRRRQRRPAPARGEGQAARGLRRRPACRPRSRSIRRATAGACPTCRPRPARRSTARPTPSAPGASCSRSTGRRSPSASRWWTTRSSRPRLTSSRRSGASRRAILAEAERLYRASLALVPGRASTLINLAAVQLRLARPGRRAAERGCRARGRARQRRRLAPSRHRARPARPCGGSAGGVPAPARDRSAPCRGVERQRHAAARAASARRGRACVSRGAAPWRRRGPERVLPRLGRGRRGARDRAGRLRGRPVRQLCRRVRQPPRRRAALPGASPAGRSAGRDLRRRRALPLGARPGLRHRAVRPAGAADGRRG